MKLISLAKSGSGGTRADQGVRPTISAGFADFAKSMRQALSPPNPLCSTAESFDRYVRDEADRMYHPASAGLAANSTGLALIERAVGKRRRLAKCTGPEACPTYIKNPVRAVPAPATPAMMPSTGNMRLREMKYSELSTSPISSNPSPTS